MEHHGKAFGMAELWMTGRMELRKCKYKVAGNYISDMTDKCGVIHTNSDTASVVLMAGGSGSEL